MKQKPEPDVMFSEYPEHEREKHLRDNAEAVVEKTVRKIFTKEEIDGLNSNFASLTRSVKAKKDELKSIVTEAKAAIKLVQMEADYTLERASRGYDESVQDCYAFPNVEDGKMEFYDKFGEFVDSRRMLPEEKAQTKMIFKNAANGN